MFIYVPLGLAQFNSEIILNHSLKFPFVFLFFTLLKAFNIYQVGSKCQSRQRQFTSAVSAPKRLKEDMFLHPFLLSFKQTSLK